MKGTYQDYLALTKMVNDLGLEKPPVRTQNNQLGQTSYTFDPQTQNIIPDVFEDEGAAKNEACFKALYVDGGFEFVTKDPQVAEMIRSFLERRQ